MNKHIARANVVLVLLSFLYACGTPPATTMIATTDTSIPEPTVTSTTKPTAVIPLTEEDKASLQLAETVVGSNDEWAVYTDAINGTEMALVPARMFHDGQHGRDC